MLVNGALAQGYTVSRVGKTDTIMVTVSRDCSIPVSKFAAKLGVPVYGDVGYGGDGWCFEVVTKYKIKNLILRIKNQILRVLHLKNRRKILLQL